VHGLDHKRGKWGRGAKAVLGTAHWMSGHVPERTVCVSQDLQAHYRREFGRETDYIPNGVNDPSVLPARRIVDEFGLEPGSYAMFVGRLVPEKAPDQLIRAYRQVPGDRRLVIVGDSSFSGEYTAGLKELARQDPRVLFTGFAFGDLLSELFRHAALFVQPSLLEGLPITLLEAASYGLPVVASDIPPHLEVLGRSSAPGRRIFATGDESALAAAITAAFAGGPAETAGAGVLRGEVLAGYNWDRATDQLERLYLDVVRGRRSRQRPASAPAGVPAGQLRSTNAEGHR
jgi:glycosyltransferase involved in cell wall biosynthesis